MCDTQFTLILFFCLFWTNVQSKRTTRAEPEDHLWSADHSLRNAGITTTGPVIQQGNTILTRQYTAPYNTYTLSCPAVPIVSAEDSTTYDLLLSTRDELATFSFPFATAFDATHKPSSIVNYFSPGVMSHKPRYSYHGYVDRHRHNTGVTQSQTGTIIRVSREMFSI